MVECFGKEYVVIIFNYNFEIDFFCGWIMCECFGVLGSFKVFVKKELFYVFFIGWMWYFLEIVFCKWKWEEDWDIVVEGLRCLLDYFEYMWFFLYCEGMCFMEIKYCVSMEVVVVKGFFVFKYYLLLWIKGFIIVVKCFWGIVVVVYDVILNFRGNKNLFLLGIFYGKKYEVDMCVRRFFLEDILLDEKEVV